MEFRILGSLQVLDDGHDVPVAGGKLRALLAMLLVHANRAVSEDVLIEALWGETASARAADNLHVLVSRLRRVLGSDRVVRDGGGYLLRVEDDELDIAAFERLRAEGRPGQALDVWRGPPLADFTYEPWAENEIRRLEELRLVALEERIEADLASGRHSELVGELHGLVAEHPLREGLRRQLILALYRSGRQRWMPIATRNGCSTNSSVWSRAPRSANSSGPSCDKTRNSTRPGGWRQQRLSEGDAAECSWPWRLRCSRSPEPLPPSRWSIGARVTGGLQPLRWPPPRRGPQLAPSATGRALRRRA